MPAYNHPARLKPQKKKPAKRPAKGRWGLRGKLSPETIVMASQENACGKRKWSFRQSRGDHGSPRRAAAKRATVACLMHLSPSKVTG
jgi:hypothetical protein